MSVARIALIVGTGPGISASFAKALVKKGYKVAVASRNIEKLRPLAESIGASPFIVDASSTESIRQLFNDVDRELGEPEVVLYNPSARTRGDFLSISPEQLSSDLNTTAVGAFTVAQEASRRMLPKNRGAIFFTGATASTKAFAKSAVFAMGKFAVRALAQSLAKELGPQGIHIAHFVIDGGVGYSGSKTVPDELFSGENIAQTYLAILDQPKGAWTWEIELRANIENF